MQLPEGSYFGKIIDAGLAEIGSNNTPAFQISFTLTHVAKGQEWSPLAQNVERDVTFFLTEKARGYAFQDLNYLGFNGDFDNPRFRDDLYKDGCEIIIDHQLYNGKTNEKASIAMLRRGKDRKEPSVDIKHLIAAQYKAVGGNNPPPVAPPVKPVAVKSAANASDEPPF